MQKLSCLIIEDEPLAAEIVQSYIEQVPFLSLAGICSDAIAALEVLKQKKIEVLFLDIHLPRLKGFDFLRAVHHPPKVIITSAYKQYALEGFEFEITDYLLKPFSFARFLKAVNRLHAEKDDRFIASETRTERPFRFFNVNKKKIKVYLDEILYVESLKDYVRIFTKEKELITKFQLGEFETFLKDPNFIRIHRSFLIAKDKIESFSSDEVEVGGKSVPIGRSYVEVIRKAIGGI